MGTINYKSGHLDIQTPAKSIVLPAEQNQQSETMDLVKASGKIFDQVVTCQYLHALSNCQSVPFTESSYSQMRWYRIDKIVKEKDVFFIDKLSMLYMALHNTAKNVILVLNKQAGGDVELYLGSRDSSSGSHISGEILHAGLEGYFPGIGFQELPFVPKLELENPSVSSVSAIASLRDDKKEEFVQGLERLINATSAIPRFRAYFVAENINETESRKMIDAYNDLYTHLSPAENMQMTYNESESDSISKSLTENFSKSIGESISRTLTHTIGSSETVTEGSSDSSSNSENILTSIWHGIVGGQTGNGYSTNSSKSQSTNLSDSESNQKGTNSTTQQGTSQQEGNSNTKTIGWSKQVTYKNRTAKYYLDILDKQLERLQNGSPFGLWSVATYFVANDPTTVQQLANIYRGSIIGEESGLGACAINAWDDASPNVSNILVYLQNSMHPCFDYCSLIVSAGSIVTSQELAIHLSLPQSSVPGIVVEERSTFARNVYSQKQAEDTINIGNILHLGKEYNTLVGLNLEELTKHVFVTGSTGSGKSNVMYLLLSQLLGKGKKFMVIEPAKGEYKHVFGSLSGENGVTVYSNTHKVGKLLQINPFIFPYKSVDVLEHVDNLVEIFNACWPMYAAMPAVLKHSIITAYQNCGWNIETSQHQLEHPIFPKIEDVVVALKDYIDNSEYSTETKGDYKGALEVRLNELCEGMFGLMLNGDSIPDEQLFNQNVIVDLSRIKSIETKALIMGFLVMKLNEFRMSEGGMNLSLKHVTVLEEAHNLLKKTSTDQAQESANLTGKSVEMISNSIAEMRTYGESFIIVDQSPSALDASAIRNTNTKIVLALPDVNDRKAAGSAMSLTDEQIEEIGKQKQGEAVVYQNIWEEPVQCKISYFEELKKCFVYGETSAPITKSERKFTAEMINFLFCPYINGHFEISKIKEEIDKGSFPSSLKFKLLKLYKEFRETSKLSVWEKNHFMDLSQMLKLYLNIDAKYAHFTKQCTNMWQLRILFDDYLKKLIDGDVTPLMLYYIELCYIRNNALYTEWKETFK